MTERQLIIKALNLLRECIINIANGRSDRNYGFLEDINACILELESLPEEASPLC